MVICRCSNINYNINYCIHSFISLYPYINEYVKEYKKNKREKSIDQSLAFKASDPNHYYQIPASEVEFYDLNRTGYLIKGWLKNSSEFNIEAVDLEIEKINSRGDKIGSSVQTILIKIPPNEARRIITNVGQPLSNLDIPLDIYIKLNKGAVIDFKCKVKILAVGGEKDKN